MFAAAEFEPFDFYRIFLGDKSLVYTLEVAIRTLVLDRSGHGVYSVGGGIVHDSVPAEEWQECHWKARILRA